MVPSDPWLTNEIGMDAPTTMDASIPWGSEYDPFLIGTEVAEMPIPLGKDDLTNIQQLEVAVNGPDGATHLILCTGIAYLGPIPQECYSFTVGPKLSRRQFVGVIASGALSLLQWEEKDANAAIFPKKWAANLISITGQYDDTACQVKIFAEISMDLPTEKFAICYNVNILAELQSSQFRF